MDTAKRRGAFISYSRSDTEFALDLAKELRAADYPVWLDQLDIPTGARWDDEVEKALREHEIFLIILTPASVSSENVKDEIGYAIDHGKRILPVLLKNCDVPLRLRRFQYVDFTKIEFSDGVRRAKQLIESLTNDRLTPIVKINPDLEAQKSPKVEAPVAPPSPIPNKPVRRHWINTVAGILALGTCMGALGAIVLFRDFIFPLGNGSQTQTAVEAKSPSVAQTSLSVSTLPPESNLTDLLVATSTIFANATSPIITSTSFAEWMDVSASELGNPADNDVGARFRAVDEYAENNGFVGGFPNFYFNNELMNYGTILLRQGAAEWRDVPVSELGYSADADTGTRFRAVHDYAIQNGFVGGFPNFFFDEAKQVNGVILIKAHP